MKLAGHHAAVVGIGLILAACSTAPTRTYTIRGPDSFYGLQQASTGRAWMEKRGIRDHVVYGTDNVAFKYGSDDIQTMSYAEFDSFVTTRIAGNTIASARRADTASSDSAVPGSLMYFGADGRFAQWSGASVLRGRWWLEGLPEAEKAKARRLGVAPPERVLCFQREVSAGNDSWTVGLPNCSPAYEQLIGIHGKQPGDVFNLLSGNAPGPMTPDYPSVWPDGQPLFPERAPHE